VKLPVTYLPPGDQWDQNLLRSVLLAGAVDAGPDDGLILVIPGRYWHDRTDEITAAIEGRPWVLAIRTGDEEDLLDPARVIHPNIRWWIQTPRVGRDYGEVRVFGIGYPPHFNTAPAEAPDKRFDVFLSAQNTHKRRTQCFDALADLDCTHIVQETAGFTQGLPPRVYAGNMRLAKIAPAPAGPASPDTFRVYEALQAHAVPIADDITDAYDSTGYWALVAPGAPFPVLTDHTDLPAIIDGLLATWPRSANRVTAWWIAHKRTLARWLHADLAALGAAPVSARPPTTVIITASPIKSHPDTAILDETVASVRAQLPDAEIVLVHDGVRPEQEHLRAAYEEYLRRVLWSADHRWTNVLPLIFDEHLHQAVAVKRALAHVDTPLVLFLEHDTPITGEIPWAAIEAVIIDQRAHCVRFHHEASIPLPHKHLMLDDERRDVGGVPMMRTAQWSQRPHLASTDFYRTLLDWAFPNDETNFIEDVVYGKLCDAFDVDGVDGWDSWRTWIYTPAGDIKRSYHTDGRAGASKFDR
jgi:hypothetical protein